jgi:hypothetical protein
MSGAAPRYDHAESASLKPGRSAPRSIPGLLARRWKSPRAAFANRAAPQSPCSSCPEPDWKAAKPK